MNDDSKYTPALTPAERQTLKAQSHALKPVVMIGAGGLSEPVLAEIDQALGKHGLIKVRLLEADREERDVLLDAICRQLGAQPVQAIGKLLIIYRRTSVDAAVPVKRARLSLRESMLAGRAQGRPPVRNASAPRKEFGSRESASRRPFADRNAGPARPFADRDGPPRRPFTDRGAAPARPFADRDGPPRRPFSDRDGPPRRPFADRGAAPARPFADRDGPPRRPFADRGAAPARPFADRDGPPRRTFSERNAAAPGAFAERRNAPRQPGPFGPGARFDDDGRPSRPGRAPRANPPGWVPARSPRSPARPASGGGAPARRRREG